MACSPSSGVRVQPHWVQGKERELWLAAHRHVCECWVQGKERELWLAAHRQVCECNHTGTSGAMETEGAKILWRRSEEVGGFCYTCLVGDGDAAVMDALSTASPYPVKKEECINHIAKRMFNALEKIIKDVNSEVKANKMKASGTTSAVKAATLLTTRLSGKGRLTRDRMKK